MLDTVHCPRYIRSFSRVAAFIVFKLLIVIVMNTVLSCYHSNTGNRFPGTIPAFAWKEWVKNTIQLCKYNISARPSFRIFFKCPNYFNSSHSIPGILVIVSYVPILVIS